jgi:hypothetical protein
VSDREWLSTNAGRGAIVTLALSLMVALWTLERAIRIEPVPEASAPLFSVGGAFATPPAAPRINVAAAVDADPFAPDRNAPETRYRAPSEETEETAAKLAPVEPVVLGTAASDAAHGFATVQIADGPATIVRVGDKIGEYTVKSIERGHVVFATPSGKKLDIPELKP